MFWFLFCIFAPIIFTVMRLSHLCIFIFFIFSIFSCNGEDRSNERPFPPTVSTKSVSIQANSCTLIGEVLSSPNSTLKSCGFSFGTNNSHQQITVDHPYALFTATIDSLKPQQNYYVVAFATNGMGTSYGDTIWFKLN